MRRAGKRYRSQSYVYIWVLRQFFRRWVMVWICTGYGMGRHYDNQGNVMKDLCKSYCHCPTCRAPQADAWRESLCNALGLTEIKCPHGWQIGHTEFPDCAPDVPAKLIPPCIHRGADTGRKVSDKRPCMGNWIECEHPDNAGLVIDRDCHHRRCKFYTAP